MKKLIALAAVCCAFAASAAIDYIEVGYGETVTPTRAGKVLGARVLSSVASGTATAKAVRSLEVWGNRSEVVATTNFTYTVVSTQLVDSAWATVTNTTAFNPLPWGAENWVSFATNTVVTLATNVTPYVSSRVVVTNALTATATCSNGSGTAAAGSDPYILPGEEVFFEGTARGKVWIIIER